MPSPGGGSVQAQSRLSPLGGESLPGICTDEPLCLEFSCLGMWCAVHCVQWTVHCVQCTVYSGQWTVCSVLWAQCVHSVKYHVLYIVQCKMCGISGYTVQCIVYGILQYTTQCILYFVVYIVYCRVYCILWSLQPGGLKMMG